eukprot:GGOE01037831.1.p1 GENE.GGOE01037831.1~~GGOE01037831.1.p1  ORF type:complete len:1243 (-),score=191.51 GGOE01037831.1:252-3980(-)
MVEAAQETFNFGELQNDRDLFKGRYERRTKLITCVNTALYNEVFSLKQLLARKEGFEYVGSTCSIVDLLNLIDNAESHAKLMKLNEWLRDEYAREQVNLERYYKTKLDEAQLRLRAKDEEMRMRFHDQMLSGPNQESTPSIDEQVQALQKQMKVLVTQNEWKVHLIQNLKMENRRLQRGVHELQDIVALVSAYHESQPPSRGGSFRRHVAGLAGGSQAGKQSILRSEWLSEPQEEEMCTVGYLTSEECAESLRIIEDLKSTVSRLSHDDAIQRRILQALERKMTDIERLRVHMTNGLRKDQKDFFRLDFSTADLNNRNISPEGRLHEFESIVAMERLFVTAKFEMKQKQIRLLEAKVAQSQKANGELRVLIEALGAEALEEAKRTGNLSAESPVMARTHSASRRMPRAQLSRHNSEGPARHNSEGPAQHHNHPSRANAEGDVDPSAGAAGVGQPLSGRQDPQTGLFVTGANALARLQPPQQSADVLAQHHSHLPRTNAEGDVDQAGQPGQDTQTPLFVAGANYLARIRTQQQEITILNLQIKALKLEIANLRSDNEEQAKAQVELEDRFRKLHIALRKRQIRAALVLGQLVEQGTMTDPCDFPPTPGAGDPRWLRFGWSLSDRSPEAGPLSPQYRGTRTDQSRPFTINKPIDLTSKLVIPTGPGRPVLLPKRVAMPHMRPAATVEPQKTFHGSPRSGARQVVASSPAASAAPAATADGSDHEPFPSDENDEPRPPDVPNEVPQVIAQPRIANVLLGLNQLQPAPIAAPGPRFGVRKAVDSPTGKRGFRHKLANIEDIATAEIENQPEVEITITDTSPNPPAVPHSPVANDGFLAPRGPRSLQTSVQSADPTFHTPQQCEGVEPLEAQPTFVHPPGSPPTSLPALHHAIPTAAPLTATESTGCQTSPPEELPSAYEVLPAGELEFCHPNIIAFAGTTLVPADAHPDTADERPAARPSSALRRSPKPTPTTFLLPKSHVLRKGGLQPAVSSGKGRRQRKAEPHRPSTSTATPLHVGRAEPHPATKRRALRSLRSPTTPDVSTIPEDNNVHSVEALTAPDATEAEPRAWETSDSEPSHQFSSHSVPLDLPPTPDAVATPQLESAENSSLRHLPDWHTELSTRTTAVQPVRPEPAEEWIRRRRAASRCSQGSREAARGSTRPARSPTNEEGEGVLVSTNTLSATLMADLAAGEADGPAPLTEDNLRTCESFLGSQPSEHSTFSRSRVPSIIATWFRSCSSHSPEGP